MTSQCPRSTPRGSRSCRSRLLDREATGLLASRLIGRQSAAGRVEEIFRRTQGLPLAITELGRLGELEEGVDAPVPISSLVERAYARGFEAASEQVRALLLLAAADDSGDLTTVLAAAERLGYPGDGDGGRGGARPDRDRGRPDPVPAPARALGDLPVRRGTTAGAARTTRSRRA